MFHVHAVCQAGPIPEQPAGVPFKLAVQESGQVISLESDGNLEELKKAAGQDGKSISVLGLIPKEKEAAQIERFELR